MGAKLKPKANDWRNRNISEWNTTTYHAYMEDLHKELFGCPYAPFRSWTIEKGLLGNIVGTTRKQGSHDKAVIKDFIEQTFTSYKPSAQYPGTSFGFMWTYRQNDLQRIIKERNNAVDSEVREEQIKQMVAEQQRSQADLDDWF